MRVRMHVLHGRYRGACQLQPTVCNSFIMRVRMRVLHSRWRVVCQLVRMRAKARDTGVRDMRLLGSIDAYWHFTDALLTLTGAYWVLAGRVRLRPCLCHPPAPAVCWLDREECPYDRHVSFHS